MGDGPLLPLRTERLTLRAFTAADADVFAGYRNDPEVARYQDWALPVTRQQAQAFVAEQRSVTGPVPGRWVQIAVDHGGELVGDVAVRLDDSGARATIGVTVRSDRQRRGFGREAVSGLVDALFERCGVHRIEAGVDPRNVASARLLELVGFRHEGLARSAVLVRGDWVDDDCYALLRDDRSAWLARPTGRPAEVRLVEITADNVSAVGRLATHHWQERFVAAMSSSFRDALFPDVEDGFATVPWLRAVVADTELVGFVMLAEVTPANPQPYLWRLLIDRWHQHRGIGSQVITLLAAQLRAAGHRQLQTSWVDQPGEPGPFYRRLGFVPTGEIDDGEVVAALPLS